MGAGFDDSHSFLVLDPMTAETSAETKAADSYTVGRRKVQMPVQVRSATASVAYYLVSAKAAQTLIQASGLRIARVVPGRTLCTIGTMDYRHNDLGMYHEVAITFFVQEPGVRTLPLIGTPVSIARGGLAAYIHQLPVDAAFSCQAGQKIWGFPKFMAQIDIRHDRGVESTTLTVEGAHVLTQHVRIGGRRSFGEREQVSYALRNGELHRTPSVMSGEGVGFRPGGARLELGVHPIAEELRSLGLPKRPLFSTTIAKMRGRFFAPQARPAS
jgi:hypothetical protein